MDENVYHCASCGGIMEFDAVSQTLKCPNCGNEIKIEKDASPITEHPLTIDDKRKIKPADKKSTTMVCSGCGAHIEVGPNDTAAKCPYCGSNYVLAEKQEETLLPDGVVPFKIDRKSLGEKFCQWIKHRWFAPNELKNLYQRGKFQGIYAPYWTFDAKCECDYTAQGGRDRTEHYRDAEGHDQTRIVTDWFYVSGHISNFFDDITEPASTRFKKGLFKGVEPFDYTQLEAYSPEYISGYLSENYSVGLDDGHNDAVEEMRRRLAEFASGQVLSRYDRVRGVAIRPYFYDETYKYLLLPVYSTSYSYKNKSYTVVINGQTGRLKGEYPKSPAKIAAAVLLCILIIAGICLAANAGRGRTREAAASYGSSYVLYSAAESYGPPYTICRRAASAGTGKGKEALQCAGIGQKIREGNNNGSVF